MTPPTATTSQSTRKNSQRSSSTRSRNTSKMVYYFGRNVSEGDGSQKQLLGGKGANLAEMSSIGLPVPPGFTITTECLRSVLRARQETAGRLAGRGSRQRAQTGKRIRQDSSDRWRIPLLVSVRSGAAVSMPGMMDTVLNLGLNDKSVAGLAEATGNERFRLRRLPPAHQHVRRRRHGRRTRALRSRRLPRSRKSTRRQARHRCARARA